VDLITTDDGGRVLKVVLSEMHEDVLEIPGNWSILVEDGEEIKKDARIAKRGDKEFLAEHSGVVVRNEHQVSVRWEYREEYQYEVASAARLRVSTGDRVKAGQQVTEGSLNPNRILRIMGREAVQTYLVAEVQKVYRSQGVAIHDKHIELIVRQMTSRVRIASTGDSEYLPGEVIDRQKFQKMNDDLLAAGKRAATGRPILLGITKTALSTDSFLAAASFQHTINVLAQAAIEGKRDELYGLKENVIIGKLIPAGTGYLVRQEQDRARLEAALDREAEDLDLSADSDDEIDFGLVDEFEEDALGVDEDGDIDDGELTDDDLDESLEDDDFDSLY